MAEKFCDNVVVGKEFPKKIIPLIKNAKCSIDIIVFDWRWYPDQVESPIQLFNNTLVKAVKNGIRCRVITNSRSTIGTLQSLNFRAKQWSSGKLLHTKLMIIDDSIVILGSHNYTMNAFNINYEVSVIFEQSKYIARLKKYFDNLWQL